MGKRQKHKLSVVGYLRGNALLVAIVAGVACCGAGLLIWRHATQVRQLRTDAAQPLVAKNIPYCNGEKLDLFVPQSIRPVPVVVYIHGGGWRYGSKAGGTVEDAKMLLDENIAVASINYHLSPRANFPVQIQDVFCAVRFLRAHSQLFNLDSQRVGLMGNSAGGHLAILAATAGDQTEFKAGPYADQSSQVQAAVGIGSHLDLAAADFTPVTQENIRRLLGKTATRSTASPVTYVGPEDPPLLIIHGERDRLVPRTQAENFVQAATSKGAHATYLPVKNADHNLSPALGILTPVNSAWHQAVSDFFRDSLDFKQ